MKSLLVTASALLACAALVAGGSAVLAGGKKTDAEKLKELKAKVTAKYKTDKGGHIFNDFVYWVDLEKAGDSRWNRSTAEGGKASEPQWFVYGATWMPSIDAKPEQTIEIDVWRLVHLTVNEGAANSRNSLVFNNTGEKVSNAEVKKLVDAKRKDWVAAAKDVDKKQNKEVKKAKGVGEAKFISSALGTHAEGDRRQRKEWLGWVNGKRGETYLVTLTFGADMFRDKDRFKKALGRAHALVKNIKIISEMK